MLNVAVRKKFLFANPCAGVEFRARVEGLFRPHYVAWSEQQKIARLPAQPHPDRHRNRTSDLKGATTRFKSTRSLVGAGRFERPTPCAQGRCATRLRYAPTSTGSFILNYFFGNIHSFILEHSINVPPVISGVVDGLPKGGLRK